MFGGHRGIKKMDLEPESDRKSDRGRSKKDGVSR